MPRLAGRRLCSYCTNGLDGNLLLRRRGDTNSYAHSYGDRDSDINTNGHAYCDSNSYAYTDSYAYGDSHSYAYTHSYANRNS